VLFSSRVRVSIRVRIRFSVWLVSCYAHVFVLLEVVYVIVTDRDLFFGRPQSLYLVECSQYCVLFSSGVSARGLDLVFGCFVVMHTYSYYFRLSLSHCLFAVGEPACICVFFSSAFYFADIYLKT